MSDARMTESAPPLSRHHVLALVGAPLVALVARAMWVPLPESDESGAYLSALAENTARADFGTLLMIASALLLIPVAFALARLARASRPRAAAVSATLITVGAVAMTALCAVALVASHLARAADRPLMTQVWDDFFTDPKGGLIFLAILLGALGFVVVAVCLYRSGAVARPAAILAGVGGVAFFVTAPGPVTPFLLAGAALALAGFCWVAKSAS